MLALGFAILRPWASSERTGGFHIVAFPEESSVTCGTLPAVLPFEPSLHAVRYLRVDRRMFPKRSKNGVDSQRNEGERHTHTQKKKKSEYLSNCIWQINHWLDCRCETWQKDRKAIRPF